MPEPLNPFGKLFFLNPAQSLPVDLGKIVQVSAVEDMIQRIFSSAKERLEEQEAELEPLTWAFTREGRILHFPFRNCCGVHRREFAQSLAQLLDQYEQQIEGDAITHLIMVEEVGEIHKPKGLDRELQKRREARSELRVRGRLLFHVYSDLVNMTYRYPFYRLEESVLWETREKDTKPLHPGANPFSFHRRMEDH